MSKKAQPQKQNPKNKAQIVDQQNEPFLRALQKKVRNINKKLSDIAQLQLKENLKPEQVEKVNRKNNLLQERSRIEQTATLFKQSFAENQEHFRNYQLKELDILARAVAVYHTHPQFPEHQKLAKLWNGLQNVNGNNLNETISNFATLLRQTANDYKLQKSLTHFTTENGQKPVTKQESSNGQKFEVHTDEIIIVHENVLNEKGEVEEIQIIEKIHDGVVEEVTVVVLDQEEPPAVTPPPTPVTIEEAKPAESTKPQPTEEKVTNTKQDKPYRERNNYRDNNRGDYRGERGGDRRGDGKRRYNDGERKAYKPKYQEKSEARVDNKTNDVREERSSSSSSEQSRVRNFKKEEIKQLQEQGFIVVGKPKPKARDQRQVYDHQHGKKHHYQNKPKPN